MDDDQPAIIATPHFYWGCCFVCRKTSKKSGEMKRCARCRSMYYCSPEHQRQHWKQHRSLCTCLSLVGEEEPQPAETRKEWMKLRRQTVQICAMLLGRMPTQDEKEVLLFPRVCRLCCRVQDEMFDCEACFCVSYCSERHREEHSKSHQVVCRQLKLAMAVDNSLQLHYDPGLPAFPSHVDDMYIGCGPDITSYVPPATADTAEVSEEELEFALLTHQLSGPLTLLKVADQFGLAGGAKVADARTLTVHIAGASLYDMIAIIKWEYLAHRLPNLTLLYMVFIGPGLQEESHSTSQCPECLTKGREMHCDFYNVQYEEYKQSKEFKKPDIVMVQNCGFSEFEEDAKGWEEGWRRGLDHLLHPTGTPLVFTSYTRGEAKSDLSRLLKCCQDVEVLDECRENAMRSHRPCRDPGAELDQDKDVFYSNQFYSVVRRSEA